MLRASAPSRTKPDSVTIAVTPRVQPGQRPAAAASSLDAAWRWNTGSAISWLMVRQWSADMRSRRLKATRDTLSRWRKRALRMRRGAAAPAPYPRAGEVGPTSLSRTHSAAALPPSLPSSSCGLMATRAAGRHRVIDRRRSGRTGIGSRRCATAGWPRADQRCSGGPRGVSSENDVLDRRIGDHPGVLRAAAALHRDHRGRLSPAVISAPGRRHHAARSGGHSANTRQADGTRPAPATPWRAAVPALAPATRANALCAT